MTADSHTKGRTPGKKQQWEQSLNVLYHHYLDYSRDVTRKFNDEDIHQARVNCRKLLTLLSILDPDQETGLYPLLKKAQKRLGRVRDADVLIEAFKKRRKKAKACGQANVSKLLKAVIQHQKAARKGYRKKLADDLPSLTGAALDEMWTVFIQQHLEERVAQHDANQVMEELESDYERKRKRCAVLFAEQPSGSEETFEALHEVRIAAKALRYTSAAAHFTLTAKYQAYEAIYKDIQEQLGEINDTRLWLENLNRIGRKKLGATKNAWNQLIGDLQAELHKAIIHNEVVPVRLASSSSST